MASIRAVRFLGVTSKLRPVQSRVAFQVRGNVGIRILDEKTNGMEKVYWAQEDERLLKKMLESNPSLDPRFQGIENILHDEAHTSVSDKIKLIFMKHGIPPLNKDLISDLASLAGEK
uniref:Uncharacterized protein n=1 Tax=Noctiluca scintillans TaxID=2966 RepID=A0A7S1ACM3_NOCSC|mmetsp:Transcript_40877/g.108337  ORF Transcript_40877/g.108337 Transcript_40877/m.108337 type:complete len:117 (+) Transcript_40877:62-412(+)|eukprot:CAMPEP_0194503366 /NCGR_PEP_ID=MMETSP0253-20130528/28343_1 /TAXON_ID=2966 /ORGANISM="Noctiluca scintillans" /LENGTH=116 /DNA_ID=CAMNT_0039345645 /DNA_START=62 /DNA_END=412 /DNA_ORIENTATION=+